MKYFFYTFITLFLATNIIAQDNQGLIPRKYNLDYKTPEFLSGAPDWHYRVYDPTNIGYPIDYTTNNYTDGYNSIYYIKFGAEKPLVTEGDYVYSYSTSVGTTQSIFGAVVYKLNIKTGEPEWTTVFDNRHSDRQEWVQSIKIHDDTLELVTMRRYDSHTVDFVPFFYNDFGGYSYACTRKYDKNTGNLLDYQCWDKEDANVFQVAPHSAAARLFEKRPDGSYIYVVNNMNDKNIIFRKLSQDGHLIYERTDTMYYPKEKYDDFTKLDHSNPRGRMYFLDNDTLLISYTYDYYDDGNIRKLEPDLAYIQMYNKELEPTKRIDIGKFVEKYYGSIFGIYINNATPEHIVLGIDQQVSKDGTYVVIDYDGNIISSSIDTSPDEDNRERIGYSGILRYSQKPYFITMSRKNTYPQAMPQTLRYYIFENGKWELKHTMEPIENQWIDQIRYLTETPEHDILFVADYGTYYKEIDAASTNTSDMWMLIDGTKLGIKTSTKDEHIANKLTLYPNPTTNTVTIANLDAPAKVDVYNLNGALVSTYDNVTSEVHIGQLPAGMYIFDISNRNVSEKHKVIRLE
ncbi:MAG: T9SS type A sorting domain-containing protein [Chitinophagales bacterium]|nr:T9SS type A sorting domain-containing protein [Chitinophagales bacterium]